jgi:uncharacterized protein YfbU (UPF0304 family)
LKGDAMAGRLEGEMFQRLVLANQYEMMAELAADTDVAEDYLDLARQVRSWWPLERLRPVTWMDESSEDPLTAEDMDFVRDVLELFDALQRSQAGRDGGAGEARPVAFPGFCGNYEGKYLGFLEWLRAQKHYCYVRLADPRDANSHMPMIPDYECMLDAWSALGRPRELGPAEAEAILAARRAGASRRLAALDT